ncbi:MAG: ImmA/IrrE family metallo-endopeptidase [Acidobacteriaceae bacterium]|nr:ImmA/IrrE family metallo-endopeptidase [Acidobacteriaceae bacterium]
MNKPVTGVKADRKCSHAGLEKNARHLRQLMQLDLLQPLNALEVFEDLAEISVTAGDGSAIPLWSSVVETEDSEGYTQFDKTQKRIEVFAAVETYEWLSSGHPRGTYFLAHELGHCCLHTDQLMRIAKLPTKQQLAFHRAQQHHPVYQDTEWQANAFASALLMPAQGLAAIEAKCGFLSPSQVSAKYQVSQEAAFYRIQLFNQRRSELL